MSAKSVPQIPFVLGGSEFLGANLWGFFYTVVRDRFEVLIRVRLMSLRGKSHGVFHVVVEDSG
jgi:hypothetical protein